MANKNRMIGKFFLSYSGKGEMEKQGQILAEPRTEVYLCQLYEWLMGEASDQIMVKFDDMLNWKFYDTKEDWNFAANQQMERERRRDESVSTDCVPN